MKYIKHRIEFLKEAIESVNISNTISFLNKKIKSGSNSFLSELKTIMTYYDYPLSNVKDENIKYMSKWPALKLKSESEVNTNSNGIYCLKFWFSLDEGFLGYTSTGNQIYNYSTRFGPYTKNSSFTGAELSHLEENIPPKYKGVPPLDTEINPKKFIPIVNFNMLKTGDIIAGYLGEDDDDYYSLGWSTIYIEEEGVKRIYAIQNFQDGAKANGDWKKYGNYSWLISKDNIPEPDHHKLHIYVPIGEDKDKTDEEKVENTLNWNLPLRRGEVKKWSDSYNSISNENEIEKADFCLVMYLDDMLDPDKAEFYERPTDIKRSREDSREGSTALMTDVEIKNQNISNYINQMVGKLGISPEKTEFKDLNKLVLKILSGKFSLISLYKEELSSIDEIINLLYYMINEKGIEEKKSYFNQIVSKYEYILKHIIKRNKEYLETERFILSDLDDVMDYEEKELFLEQYNKCIEIGELIEKLIKDMNIETIEDLKILKYKIEMINNLKDDLSFKLTKLSSILYNFGNSIREIDYILSRITLSQLRENKPKLENLEKAIRSILK